MEGGRREESSGPRKNPVLKCDCNQPARVVVVPTSFMPSQRCWRCANDKCKFVMWDGPWVNQSCIAGLDEFRAKIRAEINQRAAPPPDSTTPNEVSSGSGSNVHTSDQKHADN